MTAVDSITLGQQPADRRDLNGTRTAATALERRSNGKQWLKRDRHCCDLAGVLSRRSDYGDMVPSRANKNPTILWVATLNEVVASTFGIGLIGEATQILQYSHRLQGFAAR